MDDMMNYRYHPDTDIIMMKLWGTVIPAMVQCLFIAIIMQRDYKYATIWKYGTILCVFGNRSHRCFNRWHRVACLWKNEGVAPSRELLLYLTSGL